VRGVGWGGEITEKYLLCRDVRSMSTSEEELQQNKTDVGGSVTSARFSAERTAVLSGS